jgi:hypothetical protein
MSKAKTSAPMIGWHFVPLPGMHSTEACRVVDGLLPSVLKWLEAKRASLELLEVAKLPPSWSEEAEIRAEIGQTLARTTEWEGFRLGFELHAVHRWPVDADLVALLQRWSVGLRRTRYEAWQARKTGAKGRAA